MKDSLRGRAGFAAGGALFESKVVIYLAVDYNGSNARLAGRWLCARLGTFDDIVSHPARVDGLCDVGAGR